MKALESKCLPWFKLPKPRRHHLFWGIFQPHSSCWHPISFFSATKVAHFLQPQVGCVSDIPFYLRFFGVSEAFESQENTGQFGQVSFRYQNPALDIFFSGHESRTEIPNVPQFPSHASPLSIPPWTTCPLLVTSQWSLRQPNMRSPILKAIESSGPDNGLEERGRM